MLTMENFIYWIGRAKKSFEGLLYGNFYKGTNKPSILKFKFTQRMKTAHHYCGSISEEN